MLRERVDLRFSNELRQSRLGHSKMAHTNTRKSHLTPNIKIMNQKNNDRRSSPQYIFARALDISTGHMSFDDMKLLQDSPELYPGTVAIFPAGFIISIGDLSDEEESDQAKKDLSAAGFSHEFIKLVQWAHDHECRLIWFDRDGPCYDTFTHFDW